MKPENEAAVVDAGAAVPVEPSLRALLDRLAAQAGRPEFRRQRELALGRALRPYREFQDLGVFPLPEELELADLYLFADVFPEDGQLSLIEQIRDEIEVHVPQEERAWLDPLKHSSMDLLEIVAVDGEDGAGRVTLRSLGDGREARIEAGALGRGRVGQVLLARLIQLPDRAVLAGAVVLLAPGIARAVLEGAHEWRRELEAEAGSFALGEWREFTKRYGYVLLWMVAQARIDALLTAEASIRYGTPDGRPFLYAVAVYEHQAATVLRQGLEGLEGVVRDAETDGAVQAWIERDAEGRVVARLSLTPVQLVLECDGQERLDRFKHRLASTFGFLLHFRGETTVPPRHEPPVVDLARDSRPPVTVIVPVEEERRLLSVFEESVYLEWADRESPALNGATPRHAAAQPDRRARVAALIDRLEQDDLAARRTGRPGYEYNQLRAHVGLPEVRR
ncbi:hypothetical protein [Candidatus Nitrospira bockiana]